MPSIVFLLTFFVQLSFMFLSGTKEFLLECHTLLKFISMFLLFDIISRILSSFILSVYCLNKLLGFCFLFFYINFVTNFYKSLILNSCFFSPSIGSLGFSGYYFASFLPILTCIHTSSYLITSLTSRSGDDGIPFYT